MTTERRIITRVARTAPDDTEQFVPEDEVKRSELKYVVPGFPAEMRDRALDSFLALQLGLWQILAPLEMFSINVEALLNGRHASRKFRFERIFFDWAEIEEDRIPNNSITIQQAGRTEYTYPGRETCLLEETVDVFCPGTVLKVMHTAEVTLQLVTWMTNKDDRGGVRKALEDAFDEPEDERAGRRVIVEPYYARTARYSLASIDYQDSGEMAQENTWPLVARVKADIDVVKLIRSPGYLKRVTTRVVPSTDEL